MSQGRLVSEAGGAPHQEVQALLGKCSFGGYQDTCEERLGLAPGRCGLLELCG